MNQKTQQHSSWLAARDADPTLDEIWLHYLSMGGNIKELELDAYLHGVYPLPEGERDLIALALNELIDELPQRRKAASSYDVTRDLENLTPNQA